jgi:hypothetical protein
MKRFLTGVAVGVILALSAGFFLNPVMRNYIGSFLDEDIIYLKGGTVIHGLIVQENAEFFFVRTKSDFLSVPRAKCIAVYKNAPLYYMRALM